MRIETLHKRNQVEQNMEGGGGDQINKLKIWCQQLQQTTQLPQTNEASVDKKLTAKHIGHGPRVPCRNVRIEGCIVVEHYTNNSR